MDRIHHLSAGLAILLLVGCAADEPVPPSQTATQTPASGTETPAMPQGEVDETGSTAEPPAPAPQDDTPGLAVGTKAPVFELKDQDGENRSLADLIASGSTALVFYRSADW